MSISTKHWLIAYTTTLNLFRLPVNGAIVDCSVDCGLLHQQFVKDRGFEGGGCREGKRVELRDVMTVVMLVDVIHFQRMY